MSNYNHVQCLIKAGQRKIMSKNANLYVHLDTFYEQKDTKPQNSEVISPMKPQRMQIAEWKREVNWKQQDNPHLYK